MPYYKDPVIPHNLQKNDGHLIIERANEVSHNGRIDVIALNNEKNITFAFKHFCFKDGFFSYHFLWINGLNGVNMKGNINKGELEKIKFSQKNPYVSNDENFDLLTDEGVFDKLKEKQLHCITEKNVLQQSHGQSY